MSDVVMPQLSDSMEEGTIVRWLKADGEPVERGEEIVEIETDKATMTYAADATGTLSVVSAEGATLPIGSVIARIDGGDSPASSGPASDSIAAETPAAAVQMPARAAAAAGLGAPADPGERVKVSPLARRMARQRGIDLAALQGTGPGGRIVKADVESAGAPPAAAKPVTSPAEAPQTATGKGEVDVQEPTRAQGVIARRMAESRATVPDFTLQSRIDMERAVDARAQLAELGRGAPPSLNDMIVKACALALRELPRVNSAYRDGRFELYSRVNVGVAVATDEALVVPTVFDADRKSLTEIAAETRTLAAKVRAGTITPPEVSGATFTVSNLGMFQITNFSAVINPPQAAILAVGAVEAKPVVHEGEVVARHAMDVTLACDHRILYGADAAGFLGRVRELLEHPVTLTA
jgi:pyruvate dehydrogenase E2 component (dihydrolipoamide acetyltransferase)